MFIGAPAAADVTRQIASRIKNMQNQSFIKKPELLAPAGSRQAFVAAISAGADAVYLGAGNFNARKNADNFSLEDIAQCCYDAHLRRKKVYLAVNTLIMPEEVDQAFKLIAQAYEAGIDAIIIQDIGLASYVKKSIPDLRLHASTQMNINGSNGIEIAKKVGFSRVTLARELSLKQIAELAKNNMELEVFAHGALCICQSGQCLFSSMVGSRSANRGLCAQPCRLPYTLLDQNGKRISTDGDFLLSPKDLQTIEILPELIATGVSSLKIEGRMKSVEYVSSVVSAYRSALDRAYESLQNSQNGTQDGVGNDSQSSAQNGTLDAAQNDTLSGTQDDTQNGTQKFNASKQELDQIAQSFTRGFSTAYLTGNNGNEMMSYKRPNNRGVALGRVAGFKDGFVCVKLTQKLEVGDLLEVWTQKGRVLHEVSTMDKFANKHDEYHTRLKVKGAVSIGDRVFRVRSAELHKKQEERTKTGWKIPLNFKVEMQLGCPLLIEVQDGSGVLGCAKGQVVEAARTKAVTKEDIVEHVGRLGNSPYVAHGWDIELDSQVGIGFSALHKLRDAALQAYEKEALLQASAEQKKQRKKVGETSKSELDFSHISKVDNQAAFATRINFADKDLFEHSNIALDLEHFAKGCSIGPKLYATNIFALQTWAALGASFVWLCPELSIHQIKLLADESPLPLGLVVCGRQELMVSKHCFFMAADSASNNNAGSASKNKAGGSSKGKIPTCTRDCKNCKRRKLKWVIKDRKGYEFPITTDEKGVSHLYNAVPLDVVHAIKDLLNAGVVGFGIDCSLMSEKESEDEYYRVRRSISKKPEPKKEDTTTGHLFRPVK